MPATSKTPVRTRTRKIDAHEEESKQQKLDKLAILHFRENREMNAHKRTSDKARKELLGGMKDAGVAAFSVTYEEDGRPVALDAEILTPQRQTVDVSKLRTLCTEAQFLAIVSASAEAVTEVLGTSLLAQVLVSKAGTENVTVKAAK